MLPSLSELIYWTGLTLFELWLHATSLFIFLIILVTFDIEYYEVIWGDYDSCMCLCRLCEFQPLKIHQVYVMSYWLVFSPLFIASSFNSYFVFIIFVRSVFEYKDFKGPALKWVSNFIRSIAPTSYESPPCGSYGRSGWFFLLTEETYIFKNYFKYWIMQMAHGLQRWCST